MTTLVLYPHTALNWRLPSWGEDVDWSVSNCFLGPGPGPSGVS